MKLAPQIETLCAVLDRELDQFSEGERFYSIRELSEKFGANRRVVDGALACLERKGLIRREPYVGIFSNVNRRPQSRRLLFAVPDWPSELLTSLNRLINEQVARMPGYTVTKIFFDPARPFMAQLELEKFDALITVKPAAALSPDDLRILATQADKPLVFINALLDDIAISSVAPDNMHGGMLAADYLLRRGHRKLLVVVSEPHCGDVCCRVNAFEKFTRLYAGEVMLLDCETCSAQSSNQSSYQALSAYLERYGCNFTGVFVVSDGSVPGVLTALREFNVPVPQRVSVVGFDGLDVGSYYHPPLTTIGYDPETLVARVFAELDKCFSGMQKYFRLKLPVKIIERESVSDISPQVISQEREMENAEKK